MISRNLREIELQFFGWLLVPQVVLVELMNVNNV